MASSAEALRWEDPDEKARALSGQVVRTLGGGYAEIIPFGRGKDNKKSRRVGKISLGGSSDADPADDETDIEPAEDDITDTPPANNNETST